MNKIIITFFLSACLLVQQSNTTAFKKILLTLGAIPAFHIAKFFHFRIMEGKILQTIKKNLLHFQRSSGSALNPSKEYRTFESELLESSKKSEYNKILKSLHAYNDCLEAAIKNNLTSQNTFNDCNEYGLEFLKKPE